MQDIFDLDLHVDYQTLTLFQLQCFFALTQNCDEPSGYFRNLETPHHPLIECRRYLVCGNRSRVVLWKPRFDIVCHLRILRCIPNLSEFCGDRKSTRLNSSHVEISYAVFCLKKKK